MGMLLLGKLRVLTIWNQQTNTVPRRWRPKTPVTYFLLCNQRISPTVEQVFCRSSLGLNTGVDMILKQQRTLYTTYEVQYLSQCISWPKLGWDRSPPNPVRLENMFSWAGVRMIVEFLWLLYEASAFGIVLVYGLIAGKQGLTNETKGVHDPKE